MSEDPQADHVPGHARYSTCYEATRLMLFGNRQGELSTGFSSTFRGFLPRYVTDVVRLMENGVDIPGRSTKVFVSTSLFSYQCMVSPLPALLSRHDSWPPHPQIFALFQTSEWRHPPVLSRCIRKSGRTQCKPGMAT